MSEYAKVFAENRIDLSVLPDLTDQHLEKLGVALGDRLKILRAIRELSATAVAARPGLSAVPVVPGARVGSDRRRRRGHLSRALRRLDVRDLPSKPVAKEIIARAQGGPDQEACLVGHITGGFTDLMAGELAPARGHYVEAVDLYETRSAEASLVDRYPIDLGAIAYAYVALLFVAAPVSVRAEDATLVNPDKMK